ncbi:hypothetical protein KIPB_003659 [Kipferlia bialata]|uniref:Uncharacterized protein n=1 Tax=Kipferlia bialata TaxID=797122 RepID=A0A9K3CU75_9EUKA|nr:hypothetical protein KIPB_003659 [Kipferlia bialata]|eukprot:g3659.t1
MKHRHPPTPYPTLSTYARWLLMGDVSDTVGKVYVYEADTDGAWEYHSTLTPPATLCSDSACTAQDVKMGHYLDVYGDTIALSAEGAWSTDRGAALGVIAVFDLNASDEWTLTTLLPNPTTGWRQNDLSTQRFDAFGADVCIAEDGLAASTWADDSQLPYGTWFVPYSVENGWGDWVLAIPEQYCVYDTTVANEWLIIASGAIFVFDRTLTDWASAFVSVDDSDAGDCSIDVDMSSGDNGIMVMGNYSGNEGKVVVYALDSNRVWQKESSLQGPSPSSVDNLGKDVSIHSDVLVASQPDGTSSVLVWTRDSGVPSAPWSSPVEYTPKFSESLYGTIVQTTRSQVIVSSPDAPLVSNGAAAVPAVASTGGVYSYTHATSPVIVTTVFSSSPAFNTCEAGTISFTLEVDGVLVTDDKTADLTMGWDVPDSSLVPTFHDSDSHYSVSVTGPSTTSSLFIVWLDGISTRYTRFGTVTQDLDSVNTAATFTLPAHSTVGTQRGVGDFTLSCAPKDLCDTTITDDVLTYVMCDANGANCTTEASLNNAGSFSAVTQIATEGVWTVTVSHDGTEVHSDTIDIAPVFVTVGSDTVGVSATHSSLSGLPTKTGELYVTYLTLADLAGNPITSDLSPSVTWGGSAVSPIWISSTSSYTIMGTADSSPESYAVSVAVNSVTLLTETVTTTQSALGEFSLSVSGTCESEEVSFAVDWDGWFDVTDLLSAVWEDTTVAAVSFADGYCTVEVDAPSTPGVHTLTVTLGDRTIVSETINLSQIATAGQSSHVQTGTASLAAAFEYLEIPKDECGNEMEDARVHVVVEEGGLFVEAENLTSETGFSYTPSFDTEGIYTFTSSIDGVVLSSSKTEVAKTVVVVEGETVGVSGVHNSLSGLPTKGATEYTASLSLCGANSRPLSVDVAPQVVWVDADGNEQAAATTFDAASRSYTVSGVSGAPGSYTVAVSVGESVVLSVPADLALHIPIWAYGVGALVLLACAVGINYALSSKTGTAETEGSQQEMLEQGVTTLPEVPVDAVPVAPETDAQPSLDTCVHTLSVDSLEIQGVDAL